MGLRIPLSVLALMLLFAAPHASTADRARSFLTTAFELSPAEIDRIDAGQVVSRTLDVENRREVATLGIVRIETTPAGYVERLVDIAAFKRTEGILQIGTFSSPPQSADTASLTIDDDDL